MSFKYPDRKDYVFQNASIVINRGDSFDIVGRSGCGKSTIYKILLRFYEPE